MALIRANNKTIQNVTTLPSGITEYNLLGSDLPSGSVLNTQLFDVTPGSNVENTTNIYTTLATATYNPVSSLSTIFITTSIGFRGSKAAADARYFQRLLINSSAVYTLQEQGIYDYGGSGLWYHIPIVNQVNYSNTTGNALVLEVQAHTDNRTNAVVLYSTPYGRSTIQVTEIAG